MQLLFDLLHSLSKDEKRLYNQYKRPGRFQKIYQAYLRQPIYSKELDKQIYNEHFQDVSKPFYSMQKRSLLDDVVTVLLSYSNLQNERYNLCRNQAKAMMMVERKQGETARYYLKQAEDAARSEGNVFERLSVLRTQKQALASTEATFAEFDALLKEEHQLMQRLANQTPLEDLKQGLNLLKANRDHLSQEERIQQADRLMQHAQPLPIPDLSKPEGFTRLAIDELYYDITDQAVEFHKVLTERFHDPGLQAAGLTDPTYQYLLNMVLRSALRVGDFLLLSSLIYKTNGMLQTQELPEPARSTFLADYYETCALYHFYENELQLALEEIDNLLKLRKLDDGKVIRCVHYYVAMLLTVHLPEKALSLLQRYRKRYAALETNPGTKLLEIILRVDNHENTDEVLLNIEKYKTQLRKMGGYKPIIDALVMVENYLERKRAKIRYVPFFPNEWEEILRIDLWLQAKRDNKFYYNLMYEAWQDRKQVFT